MPLEETGVERHPPLVGELDLRGDDEMGVELRVVGATGGLTERGHRQTVGIGMHPRPVRADTGGGAEALEVVGHGTYGDVVTLSEAVVAGEGPQHRQRLRG